VINPWDWLREWCRADSRRHARFDVDLQGEPQVTLEFVSPGGDGVLDGVTRSAPSYDVALIDAMHDLPDEVRR
jgi:hypothetical protein